MSGSTSSEGRKDASVSSGSADSITGLIAGTESVERGGGMSDADGATPASPCNSVKSNENAAVNDGALVPKANGLESGEYLCL